MTGIKRGFNWQDKEIRKIEELQYDGGFKADITALPSGDFEARFGALLRLTEKYKLSADCCSVLDQFAKTGKIEPREVVSGMSVICELDETAGPTDSPEHAQFNYAAERGFAKPGLNIFIPPGTTRTALKSFIDSSWPYIEAKLSSLGNNEAKGSRRKRKAKRDAMVISLHKSGYKPREIAQIINETEAFDEPVSYNDVSQIIRRKS